MNERDTPSRRELVWLAGICAAALVLRVVRLDAELWYDEILTLVRFVRLPLGELVTTYSSLNNHLLYSLEAKASLALFGEQAWALRLPAALFGVASIAAAYALAREVVGAREARVTALLLAVSYHHVWFSQNARGYTGLLFWTTLGTWLFVRASRQRSFRLWAAYALTIAAAGYTHLTAALFFACHAIVYGWLVARRVLRERQGRDMSSDAYALAAGPAPLRAFLLGAGLTALLYAPVVPQMWATFSQFGEAKTVKVVTAVAKPVSDGQWRNPLWTALETVQSFGDLGPLLLVGLPVALALLAFGMCSLFKQKPLLAAVYIVNVPFTMLLLVLAGFRLWPRYFFVDIAFLLLCVVRGVFATAELVARRFFPAERRTRVAELGVLAVSGIAVAASLLLLPKNYRLPKQAFEGALKYVESARAGTDAVAVVGLARVPYEEYYKPSGWSMVADAAELDAVRARPGPTWLVYAFSGHAKSRHPDVMEVAARDFRRKQAFPGTLGDGTVVVLHSER